MKNLIRQTFFGRSAMASLVVIFGILFLVVLGCRGLIRNNKTVVSTETNTNLSSTPVPVSTPKSTYAKANAAKKEMPSDAEIQDMVKTTLLDFNKAVQAADFTDFHANIANEWRKEITAEEMKTSFQGFIDKGVDIEDISPLDATISPDPVIEKEIGYQTLKIRGRYATSPTPTKFFVHYIANGKEWKLSRIEVSTKPD
jgi:hypothetical protein